ncbi:MAG: hypothetical protein OEO77_14375 [Acidimicrobiia bacterium]|nr:hypothetical protein [Acidimicrobiia bacterium]
MRYRLWPVAQAAQADYEELRAVAIAGERSISVAARRFDQLGLAGLIAWPASEATFAATLIGADRPPWTPHADPRIDAVVAGYGLLFEAGGSGQIPRQAQR